MYKPSDSRPHGGRTRARRLAAVAAVAVAAFGGALLQPSVQATASRPGTPHDAPPAAKAAARPPGTYQLRCWQYGRLLFDEGPVTLPAEARQGARLVALDRNGAAIIVTDTGGTTCQARPSAPAPNLALPR